MQPLRVVEAASFAAALGAGLLLMQALGYRLGYPRWLSAKLGLVAFLLVPLGGFRVYLSAAWLGPGLRASSRSVIFARTSSGRCRWRRCCRPLPCPCSCSGCPAILWLSLARPF